MLKSAGAMVDGEIVKLPQFIVRQCLATAPKGWTIYDREGHRALDVEGRNSYYGTSTASPNTKDALTGEYHETRVADLALAAKVADALENIIISWSKAFDFKPGCTAVGRDIKGNIIFTFQRCPFVYKTQHRCSSCG